MKWFRWYRDTVQDTKFRVIAREWNLKLTDIIAVWAALLEDACCREHRGICTRGDRHLAASLELTKDTVTGIMCGLYNEGLLQVEKQQGLPDKVSITKWGERQYESDHDTGADRQRRKRWKDKHNGHAPVTRDSGYVTASDTESDTDKKEEVRASPKARPSERGSRMTIEEYPEEWRQFCECERPDLDSNLVWREFKDYWRAKPGKDGRKLDWFATWRNWVRHQRTQPRINGHEGPKHLSAKPPEGFRNATTQEYITFMRQKLNDPTFDFGHPKFSRWQVVPLTWQPH